VNATQIAQGTMSYHAHFHQILLKRKERSLLGVTAQAHVLLAVFLSVIEWWEKLDYQNLS
jgi:hypothetical protein